MSGMWRDKVRYDPARSIRRRADRSSDKKREWNFGISAAQPDSDDPGTDKAFADFKTDESDKLKLLFCIDMLNEGVHVEGISGVILFRPTISPIIYKQQIGRALTAGDTAAPLILDVVNNFEGLCI